MNTTELKLPGLRDYFTQEAYNVLRTNIQFSGQDVKIIAVTSCGMNEGKTVVSLHIGRSLAELGKRVLVIDADMRKSVMAGRNSTVKGAKGLSEVLTGQKTFSECIYATQFENFHVLFSGQYPPNPVDLLDGKYFEDVLDAVLGGEVDEVLVGGEVIAADEVHVGAVGASAVPPLPTDLSGLEPGEIAGELAGRCEAARHGGGDEVGVGATYGDVAPGQRTLAADAGHVVGLLKEADGAVAIVFPLQRLTGEVGREAVGAVATEQHAGVVDEVGLADEQLDAGGGVDVEGQFGEFLFGAPGVGSGGGVAVLVVAVEAAWLLYGGGSGSREVDAEGLAHDVDGALAAEDEAGGVAIIVGTEIDGPTAAEGEADLIVMVAHLGELEGHDGADGLIGRGELLAGEDGLYAQRLAGEGEGQGVVLEDDVAVDGDGVGEGVGHGDVDGQLAVR